MKLNNLFIIIHYYSFVSLPTLRTLHGADFWPEYQILGTLPQEETCLRYAPPSCYLMSRSRRCRRLCSQLSAGTAAGGWRPPLQRRPPRELAARPAATATSTATAARACAGAAPSGLSESRELALCNQIVSECSNFHTFGVLSQVRSRISLRMIHSFSILPGNFSFRPTSPIRQGQAHEYGNLLDLSVG